MINEVDADLLKFSCDGIIHSCNCFHTQSAGIARLIREKYPEAYRADIAHGKSGDLNRLGQFSVAILPSNFHIFNVYGQYQFGGNVRNTSYDAICNGLTLVEKYAIDNGLKTLGLPKKMGSMLGGGNWTIVRSIIGTIFDNSPIQLTICNYN